MRPTSMMMSLAVFVTVVAAHLLMCALAALLRPLLLVIVAL